MTTLQLRDGARTKPVAGAGVHQALTFTLESVGHPIWTGLPNSFTTTVAMGANIGNTLSNGGVRIAGCTQCSGAGVVVRATAGGRMATKNEEPSGTVNTENILHEKVVAYSNSVGCKIGTKSMGQSVDGVVFRDIDVVNAGRALTLEGYDTVTVRNPTFEDIRVEATDVFIKLALDEPPDWRSARWREDPQRSPRICTLLHSTVLTSLSFVMHSRYSFSIPTCFTNRWGRI